MPWPFLQVEVIKKAYMQGEVEFEDGENGEDGAASPRNVGHNIYILAHQVRPLPAAPPNSQGQHSTHAPSHLLFLQGLSPRLFGHMVTWLTATASHLTPSVRSRLPPVFRSRRVMSSETPTFLKSVPTEP